MFNSYKAKFQRYSMARGPRAIMPMNFAAGARKFRLVEINDETNSQISAIKNSIRETYSGDGGELYFLFASENKYSEAMDVNDNRTILKMEEERDARKSFVESIYLKDYDELTEEEEKRVVEDLNILEQIAVYLHKNSEFSNESPEEREKTINKWIQRNKESDLFYLMEMVGVEKNNIFGPLLTNDKNKSHYSRFAIDRKKLKSNRFNALSMGPESIYRLYNQYTNSAGYHPELDGKGEIQMLEESIRKLQEVSGGKYDVNSYISDQIENMTDDKKNGMEWMWYVVKKLKLPLQYPSWVAIGWPQGKSDALNLKGSIHGQNREIEDLRDLTFVDPETERKLTYVGGEMIVPKKSEGIKLPVTPHTTLLEIIGTKPSTGQNRKTIEKLRNDIQNALKGAKITTGKKRENLVKKVNSMRYSLSLLNDIRDNMISIPHTDTNSVFYLYDEICNLYFQYNRERCGDGIMLRFSAFSKNKAGERFISHSIDGKSGQTNRPFIPTTLHDDLREIVISVKYAYGTEIPQLALTSFPGQFSKRLDENMINKLVEKASNMNLSEVTLLNNELTERTIPVNELPEFFNRMSSGKTLVYRIKSVPEEEDSGIIWYTGMRSFGNRYDETKEVTRTVYDEEQGLITIRGYGSSRISSGTAATSSEFTNKLFMGISQSDINDVEKKISVTNWEDVYVGNDFLDVYRYANSRYGLDYDYEKIDSVVAKKINPITSNVISEVDNTYKKVIKDKIKTINKNKNESTTIIPERTDKLIREIISEISSEPVETKEEIVQAPVENVNIQEQIPLQNQSIDPNQINNIPQTQYEFNENDMMQVRKLQNEQNMNDGITIDPFQMKELQDKGYIIERNGDKYKIVQFPSWSKTAVPLS